MATDTTVGKTLEEELEALAVAEDARQKELAKKNLQRKLAAEKKKVVAREAVEKLLPGAEEDIDYRLIVIDDVVVAVKRPAEVAFRKFRDGNKTDCVSCDRFIKPYVVYPDYGEYVGLCEVKPALADLVAGAGLFLCGARQEQVEKK